MNQIWFANISGSTVGPYSWPEIQAMAAAGRLSPLDQLREGDGQWMSANKIGRLLFPENAWLDAADRLADQMASPSDSGHSSSLVSFAFALPETKLRPEKSGTTPASAPCPYCGTIITPSPRPPRRCKACKNTIRVKQGSMLTQRQYEDACRRETDERLEVMRQCILKSLATMRETGIKKFEYMAALDSDTCTRCGTLDGKKVRVATCTEWDLPPFADCTSPSGCRTTIAAVIEDTD